MSTKDMDEKPGNTSEVSGVASNSGSAPTKTPMYQATNAARYQRQALIKEINKASGHPLICFVCEPKAAINRDDTLGFVDLLHNLKLDDDLDLLLHTPGGDVDAAEKLINLVHTKVGAGSLRVIVPDFAKSAGTLMASGANKILMSDSSELGPIDPQVRFDDGQGNRIWHSVLDFLDAYRQWAEALRRDPNDPVARMMIAKFHPATVRMFETVRDRARSFAETQLKKWMFQNNPNGNFSQTAADLIDNKKWQSHGQMIGADDALQIGLEVEKLDPSSEIWRNYWQLYCLQRFALKDGERLFESDYVSLAF